MIHGASSRLINKKTITRFFTNSMDSESTCIICLDEFKLKDKLRCLPCKHFFHDICITDWLKRNETCPLCRKDIDENKK